MKLKNQSGMVLLVALVMVALMSVIAVAAIRGSNMQEAMAGNLRDKNLAFQAAEAGLRAGEKNLSAVSLPAFGSFASASAGYYNDIYKDSISTPANLPTNWSDSVWNSKSIRLAANTIPYVASQPQVVHESIEATGTALTAGGAIDFESRDRASQYQFFRVTSRASGLTPNSQVILQSTFVR